jgi:hypothetical protein
MIRNANFFVKFFIYSFFLFQVGKAFGQFEVEEEPKRLYYERLRRITNFWEMKDMRDVTHKDKLLMGKNRISGNYSYNFQRIILSDEPYHEEWRSALGIYTKIRFWEQFSFNSTFYIDFNKAAAAKWTSNFTYSIGRYNWKPNRFNFGYENYVNNRYSDSWKEFGNKFLEGYYFLSYSNNAGEKVMDKIKFDESTNIRATYFARYSIKYTDQFDNIHGGLVSGKTILGAGIRYTIMKKIYVEGAVYYYPETKKKQAWDPDYTYGFGYFDWRSFRVSLSYGNWAVNRFPWEKQEAYKHYSFLDGNFKVTASWIW